jgi:hypothetical protein
MEMGFVTNIIADYGTDFPSYGYVHINSWFNDKWSGFVENQGFKVIFIAMQLFVVVPLIY